MTNPTREQIEAAYNALEELYNSACALTWGKSHEEEEDWHSAILKVLPPLPKPTMADIEWDDEKHYLAEAELAGGTKVIMLWETAAERITFIEDGITDTVCPKSLTPTGRRYTLTEVQDD